MTRVVKYTKPHKVKVGDEILGYGVVIGFNKDGTMHTDTGYEMLSFPADDPTDADRGPYTVPVLDRRFKVVEG